MDEPARPDVYAVCRDRGVFLDRHADLLLDGHQYFLGIVTVEQGDIQADHYSVGLLLRLEVRYLGKPGHVLEDDLDKVEQCLVRDRIGAEGREGGTHDRPVGVLRHRSDAPLAVKTLTELGQRVREVARELVLDLHARNGDGVHSLRKPGAPGDAALLFGGDVLDPDEHRGLVQPEVRAYLAEHRVGRAEDHEGLRHALDQGAAHDGRSRLVDEDRLPDRFHFGGSFLGRGSGDDAASVDQETVVYDVVDVVLAGDPDCTGALAGTRRPDESDHRNM